MTGSGESLMLIERSALPVTLVVVDAELFAAAGSAVVAPTVALSVIEPAAAGAVVVIVIAGAAPVASAGRVHVTTCPAAEHAQPAPLALTNPTPAGSVFVTV